MRKQEQEQELVERHIFSQSKEISPKQFDYFCGQDAVRGSFYDRYRKGLVK